MPNPRPGRIRNDLWFLTGFSVFLTVCAALRPGATVAGAGLTAAGLALLLVAGWHGYRRSGWSSRRS